MTKTIFKDRLRPQFDEDGTLYMPQHNVLFGGQIEPKLTPKEWLYLYFREARDLPDNFMAKMIGAPRTISRVRRSLKQKGYL